MKMQSPVIITIDGPSATGKSTIAQLLAKKLQYVYLQSGLFYRIIAYIALQKKIAPELLTTDIVHELLSPATLHIISSSQTPQKVLYYGSDITPQLKNTAVSKMSSIIATYPAIREVVKKILLNQADEHNIVAEGRDMGSVVFPHATVKFFMTAKPEIRAQRWQKVQKDLLGIFISREDALKSITERDQRDTTRAESPLVQPKDAHVIDTSYSTPEELVAHMILIIQKQIP